MSAGISMKGLTELAQDLARLPGAVRATFKPILVAKGQALESGIQGEYDARGVSSVGEGMHVEVDSDPTSLGVRVVNPSPTGHLYEHGTAARYDGRGRYRGRMPAANVMRRQVEKARAELPAELERGLAQVGR